MAWVAAPLSRLSRVTYTTAYCSLLPVVQPPTVGILGAGATRDEVRAYQGAAAIRRVMPLSLTFDHRAVTGGEAARFLKAVVEDIEKAK